MIYRVIIRPCPRCRQISDRSANDYQVVKDFICLSEAEDYVHTYTGSLDSSMFSAIEIVRDYPGRATARDHYDGKGRQH